MAGRRMTFFQNPHMISVINKLEAKKLLSPYAQREEGFVRVRVSCLVSFIFIISSHDLNFF
jgi:hypothetical protein